MFSIKNYHLPTPKRWRQLGDTMLIVATSIVTGGFLNSDDLKVFFGDQNFKIIMISSFASLVIGKFLTNFFKEDNDSQ